jgi:hypothetical protein
MKRITIFLILITIVGVSCIKDDNTEIIDQEQELRESNLAFINSDWTFDATGDSLKDHIIGLWLSYEISYENTICNDCDSVFTWVFESTGTMVKRNNIWGDNETLYGNWEIDSAQKFIYFSYKDYAMGGTIADYRIVTDTINIENLSKSLLWTSQYINHPQTTKMVIKFNRLK